MSKTEAPPACVACKWVTKDVLFLWCTSPARYLDVVTGKPQKMICDDARRWEPLCGPSGKWFEARLADPEIP